MNNIKFGIYKDNRLITVIEASCLEEAILRAKNLGYGEDYRLEDIEEFEIRKDGDVTMCDLLDKEIEQLATDNNVACKEIEEMAKAMAGCEKTCDECFAEYERLFTQPIQNKGNHCHAIEYCSKLYNAGYRNVKDKVVLSKKEYQNDFSSQFNKGYEKGSKETAKEILAKAQVYYHQPSDTIILGINDFYEIAKEYGVEIKE